MDRQCRAARNTEIYALWKVGLSVSSPARRYGLGSSSIGRIILQQGPSSPCDRHPVCLEALMHRQNDLLTQWDIDVFPNLLRLSAKPRLRFMEFLRDRGGETISLMELMDDPLPVHAGRTFSGRPVGRAFRH